MTTLSSKIKLEIHDVSGPSFLKDMDVEEPNIYQQEISMR